jgi:hypothetical protein
MINQVPANFVKKNAALSRWVIGVIFTFSIACVFSPPHPTALPSALLSTTTPSAQAKMPQPGAAPANGAETLPPVPTLAQKTSTLPIPAPSVLTPAAQSTSASGKNLSTSLPGTPATPSPKGLALSQQYTEPDAYQLDYPKGWVLSKNGDWDDFCMDQAKTACFHVQVLNTNEDSLAAFMADAYEAFKSSVGSYRLVRREDVVLAGCPAVVIEESYELHSTTNQGFAAYLVNKGAGYHIQAEITGQMTSDQYTLIYHTLRNMINSFTALNVKDARAG